MTSARQWLDTYADRVGLEPISDEDLAAVLDLAAVAAHASERMAAPVTCWLVAKAGLGLHEAMAIANELAGAEDT